MSPTLRPVPRIVVTLAVAADRKDPAVSARKNALYVEALERHGAEVTPLDASASPEAREAAFSSMTGLLLTGGADLDPSIYGATADGATDLEPERDALERAAWDAAETRALPVLGICRGFQAMNAFAGGRLVQHVEGHLGSSWGHGPAATHPLRLLPGSRLARILFPTNVGGGVLTVNSYHHQAVRRQDVAPGFSVAGVSPSPAGELVEALEATGPLLRIGVQCHPERTESTPPAFERLFAFFVDACRGPLSAR